MLRSCAAKPTKYGRPRKLEQPRVVQTIPGAAPNGLGGVVVAVLEKQKLPVLCTLTVFVAMAPLLQWLSDDSQRLCHSCFQANNLHSRINLRSNAQKHVEHMSTNYTSRTMAHLLMEMRTTLCKKRLPKNAFYNVGAATQEHGFASTLEGVLLTTVLSTSCCA